MEVAYSDGVIVVICLKMCIRDSVWAEGQSGRYDVRVHLIYNSILFLDDGWFLQDNSAGIG